MAPNSLRREDLSLLPAVGQADLSELRRLPNAMLSCTNAGMSASDIGQLVHGFMFRCDDPSLTGVVTKLIDNQKPYYEIGIFILKSLNLCNSEGRPLHEVIELGDRQLKADPAAPPPQTIYLPSNSNAPSAPTLGRVSLGDDVSEWAIDVLNQINGP